VNQIDTAQAAGRTAAAVLTTAQGLQKFVPEYYGGMADYGYSAANAMSRLLLKRTALGLADATPAGNASFLADLRTSHLRPAGDTRLSRNELTLGGEWQVTPVVGFGGLLTVGQGNLGGDHGSGKAEGGAVRLYGKVRLHERVMLVGGLGHGSYDYDLTRQAVTAEATGNTRGRGTDLNLGLAFDAYRRTGFSVAPYLSLDRGNFRVNGFSEQGASEQRLVLDGYDSRRTTATLGSTFTWQRELGGRPVNLTVDAALQGVLQEGNRTMATRLAVDESIALPLTLESRKRVQGLVGVGASVNLGRGFTADVSYDAALSGRRDDSFKVQLMRQF